MLRSAVIYAAYNTHRTKTGRPIDRYSIFTPYGMILYVVYKNNKIGTKKTNRKPASKRRAKSMKRHRSKIRDPRRKFRLKCQIGHGSASSLQYRQSCNAHQGQQKRSCRIPAHIRWSTNTWTFPEPDTNQVRCLREGTLSLKVLLKSPTIYAYCLLSAYRQMPARGGK